MDANSGCPWPACPRRRTDSPAHVLQVLRRLPGQRGQRSLFDIREQLQGPIRAIARALLSVTHDQPGRSGAARCPACRRTSAHPAAEYHWPTRSSRTPTRSARMLFVHCVRRAASRAAWIAGNSSATRMPMMAITTNSSTSVNARIVAAQSLRRNLRSPTNAPYFMARRPSYVRRCRLPAPTMLSCTTSPAISAPALAEYGRRS